jgi:hypothetical protein
LTEREQRLSRALHERRVRSIGVGITDDFYTILRGGALKFITNTGKCSKHIKIVTRSLFSSRQVIRNHKW